jgi:hypothetical protein
MVHHLKPDSLRSSVLEIAGCRIEEVLYGILYGSTVHAVGEGRDLDVLLVCHKSNGQFLRTQLQGRTLNLHIVNPTMIEADVLEDKYGWIFLTKFLDDFEVIFGDEAAAKSTRARAYLRILGQWAAENDVNHVSDLSKLDDRVISVLSRWNPQFEVYLRHGDISRIRYQTYLSSEFRESRELRALCDESLDGFTFGTLSRFLRRADLRIVLVRYWCFYMFYQLSSDLYLSPLVDELLRKKKVIK